jgi:dTMP kinase
MQGKLLVIEGMGGSGKSTTCDKIEKWLQDSNIPYVRTREPGGTFAAEYLRQLCRQGIPGDPTKLEPITVALLYNAARAENVAKVIRPALAEGKVVLCDRFVDSTIAYQGGYGGVGTEVLQGIHDLSHGLDADLTLLLDGVPATFLMRISDEEKKTDQFDNLKLAEYDRVREAYRERAYGSPSHRVINAMLSEEQVWAQILPFLMKLQNDLLQRPATRIAAWPATMS